MRQEYPTEVKKWDVFEIALAGPTEGNPFLEQSLKGIFTNKNESVVVNGFYDGDGVYRIRFMPSYEGRYTFVLMGSFLEENLSGVFYATENDPNNHGVVRVNNTYHFAYDDGSKYYAQGTTAEAWHLQNNETIEKTLKELEANHFNKLRFFVFPKHYLYSFDEPRSYPYEGTPVDSSDINEDNWIDYAEDTSENDFDYMRFNPAYFQNLENCIQSLAKRGIEADLVLFHPYDRWGFASLSDEETELYLNYMINRFAAYHNIWWSLASEYDVLADRSVSDWEYYANIFVEKDPYRHLRSINNGVSYYDYSRPWITHCSIQRVDLYKGAEETGDFMKQYKKPVVYEDMGFEGDLPYGYGNLPAEELVRRFWEVAVRGGYPSHGEAYLSDDDKLWFSHGGTLKGVSQERLDFLANIMKEVNGSGLIQDEEEWDSVCGVPVEEYNSFNHSFYLYYYSFMRPSYREFYIDEDTDYLVEVIDTWNMTRRKAGIFQGQFKIELPAKPYMAVLLRIPSEEDYLNPVDEVVEEDDLFEVEEEILESETVEPAAFEFEEDSESHFPEGDLYVEGEEIDVNDIEDINDIEEDVEEVQTDAEIFANAQAEEEIEEFEFLEDEPEVIETPVVEEDVPQLIEEDFGFDETEFIPHVSVENTPLDDDMFDRTKEEPIIELSEDTLELPAEEDNVLNTYDEEFEELPDIVTGSIPVINSHYEQPQVPLMQSGSLDDNPIESTDELEEVVVEEKQSRIPSLEETLNILNLRQRFKKDDE